MAAEYYTTLTINKLLVMVKLGTTEEEREVPQPVEIDITFFFPNLPDECMRDTSEPSLCYKDISDNVQDFAEKNEFKLIEYFAYQVFLFLRNFIPEKVGVLTKVTKCNPPVDAIQEGCTVVHSDLPIRIR